MTAPRIWIGVAILYAAIAVFSFGHAAAHYRCDDTKHTCVDNGQAAGMGAALLWPFYWSWELQS